MKKILAVLMMLLVSNVYAEGVVVIPLFEDDDDSNDDQSYGVYDANDERIGTTYDGSALLVVEGDGNRAGDVYRQSFTRDAVVGGDVFYTGENCTGIPIWGVGADQWACPGGYFDSARIGVEPSDGPWAINTPIPRDHHRAFLFKNPDSLSSLMNLQSTFKESQCRDVSNVSVQSCEFELVNDVSIYVPPFEVKAD